MAEPARFISGLTQDQITQPLGGAGFPNPFFYAVDADDFMPYRATDYSETISGTGSIVATAGVGGNILMSTDAVLDDVAAIQRAVANFQYYPTRRVFYLCRIRLTALLPTVFRGGLLNLGAPFAATDGVFFSKAAGSLFFTLNVMSGGVLTGSAPLPIPGLTNNFVVDLGFQIEPEFQDVVAFCGQGLVGEAVGQYNTQALGPQARITPTAWPVTALSPTLAVQSGAATTAVSLTADFQLAALQRKNGG